MFIIATLTRLCPQTRTFNPLVRAFHLWDQPKDSRKDASPVSYKPISVSSFTRDKYDLAIGTKGGRALIAGCLYIMF